MVITWERSYHDVFLAGANTGICVVLLEWIRRPRSWWVREDVDPINI